MKDGEKMKTITIILILILSGCIAYGYERSLERVEKLNEAEQKMLSDAKQKVVEAQSILASIETLIAQAHNMAGADNMEYTVWFKIEAPWILYYRTSYEYETKTIPLTLDSWTERKCKER